MCVFTHTWSCRRSEVQQQAHNLNRLWFPSCHVGCKLATSTSVDCYWRLWVVSPAQRGLKWSLWHDILWYDNCICNKTCSRFRGTDGLPRWSPSQVIASIWCLYSVLLVCVLLCPVFHSMAHLGNATPTVSRSSVLETCQLKELTSELPSIASANLSHAT